MVVTPGKCPGSGASVDLGEGVSGPEAKKSPKSLEKVSRGSGPKSPKKVSKKVRKVSENPFSDFFFDFSDLFRDFFRTFGPRPRETFFETFWLRAPRLLLPGPRNLNPGTIWGRVPRRSRRPDVCAIPQRLDRSAEQTAYFRGTTGTRPWDGCTPNVEVSRPNFFKFIVFYFCSQTTTTTRCNSKATAFLNTINSSVSSNHETTGTTKRRDYLFDNKPPINTINY